MRIDKEYPATHSMSTAWYIADDDGNVGILYFNENGPVPKETEQTGIEDLMFGHDEGGENKYLTISLTKSQIFEMLSQPRLPEDTESYYYYNTVIQIDTDKEKDFFDLLHGDDASLERCISRELGLYHIDFYDAIIEARGNKPRHIRLKSTLKRMLDRKIILRTYEMNRYWINDEYVDGKVIHTKEYDNSPYYIYHQPYCTDYLPKRMNIPIQPVKIDQLPEKIRDRVLHIPLRFSETEHFQPAEWSLCDIFHDDMDIIIVDGYEYTLLPLTDGTEAYINIDINPLDFFDYCSEKEKFGCTQCSFSCYTCQSRQFTNRPTVMHIVSPYSKIGYMINVKSDLINQHSIILPFLGKIPYNVPGTDFIMEDEVKKKVSEGQLTAYFIKNYRYIEDMIGILRPRVIIVDANARKALSQRYDLSNHEIEIAGEKYPMYFRSEIIFQRKAIEELANMPYRGREIPHIISKEEGSRIKQKMMKYCLNCNN